MKIDRVTLTGADDGTDWSRMRDISEQYPYVEWGILFSFKRMGTERYPSLQWINDFVSNVRSAYKSIHLCGSSVVKYVEAYPVISGIVNCFDRVQLNFSATNHNEVFFDYLKTRLEYRDHENEPVIITQFNEKNGRVLAEKPVHSIEHFLFDASGGRGQQPTSWRPPLDNQFCGYAGGLGPDNLEQELKAISEVAGDAKVWVDMESKVRTIHRPSDDLTFFDLDKCVKVLEIAKPYIGM